ncbi:MAG: molecular chaperone HtpG [Burkholderiales bacterium]|nr:molecular chaperone HtpG [Burkholderiales bacterium]
MNDETTANAAGEPPQTHGFQAEVKQLLSLMIHSLYSHPEIFLRELISNASDAADKLRFEALDHPRYYEDDPDLAITVSFDKEARTISVRDNGIGMSRDEVIAHIGTIAKSGTREFFASLSGDQAKDARLIGQFGVGFYSSFIVADRVTLVTRRAGLPPADGVRWESAGEGEYTLERIDRPARGTEVTLHLREGHDELLSRARLASIIRKYSDHIALPIVMRGEVWDADKQAYRASEENETVNQASALWARPKSEITAEQYDEFYRHVAHDGQAPLAHVHARVEGRTEYTLLLYVPATAPFDLWDRDREHRHGVKLYVRRVFIMDDADQLLPPYLRFVRGVVDSNDLPLNVSREILQHSRDVEAIRGGCVKRVLDLLSDLADNEPEKYATFWRTFGNVLKEGFVDDYAQQERLAKLVRFASTASGTDVQEVSLSGYVGRMKEGQQAIYFVTADSHAAAAHSPHLEFFRKKGIEVLLLSDRIDEWVATSLTEFEGKPLRSVAKGALDLGELADAEEKAAQEEEATALRPLVERLTKALGERVREVRVTHRLTDSPACLVVGEGELSGNLERLLRSAGQKAPAVVPILEINPRHALVRRIDGEGEERLAEWAELLLDEAVLAEGAQLPDPAGFVRRLNALMFDAVAATVAPAERSP